MDDLVDLMPTSIHPLLETCCKQFPELTEGNLGAFFESLPWERTSSANLDVQRGDILIRRQYGHHEGTWYGVVESVNGYEALVYSPSKGRKSIPLSNRWEVRMIRLGLVKPYQETELSKQVETISEQEDGPLEHAVVGGNLYKINHDVEWWLFEGYGDLNAGAILVLRKNSIPSSKSATSEKVALFSFDLLENAIQQAFKDIQKGKLWNKKNKRWLIDWVKQRLTEGGHVDQNNPHHFVYLFSDGQMAWLFAGQGEQFWRTFIANKNIGWDTGYFIVGSNLNLPKEDIQSSSGNSSSGQHGKTPSAPLWVKDLLKKLKDIIKNPGGQGRLVKGLPDQLVLWYKAETKTWYLNVWVYFDVEGKDKTSWAIPLIQGETPENLLERVRDAVEKALQKADAREEEKRVRALPEWAIKLLKDLEVSLETIRKKENNPNDIPAGITLQEYQRPKYIKHVDGSFEIEEHVSEIRIQIWIEDTINNKIEKRYGVIDLSLSKDVKSEELIGHIRHKTAILRMYEKVPFGLHLPVPEEVHGSIKLSDKEALAAFPSKIISTDLSPNGITVTNARNEFIMWLNFEAVYGVEGGPLHVAQRATSEYIHFFWKIYKLPDELNEIAGNLMHGTWEEKSQWLNSYYSFFNFDSKTAFLKTPYYEMHGSSQEKLHIPSEPGDYIIFCVTAHGPIGSHKLKRNSSRAYLPVRVKNAEDIADENIQNIPDRIRVIQAELQQAEMPETLKKEKQKELDSLLKQEQLLLPDLITQRIAEIQAKIDLLIDLKQRALTYSEINGSKNKDPFELALTPEMNKLWISARKHIPGIDTLRKELETQLDEFNKLSKRIQKYSGDFVSNSRYKFRPEATLVSEVDGKSYDLLLMLGETRSVEPIPGGGTYVRFILADVSTPQTAKVYEGISNDPVEKSGYVAYLQAITDAFVTFGEENEYGQGYVYVRIPQGSFPISEFHPGGEIKKYRSSEGTWQKVKRWLGYLAMAATIIALAIGTVASAGTALAFVGTLVGTVAAITGSVVAIENIKDRSARKRLKFDAELIMDILSVAGIALSAIAAITKIGGRLSKVLSIDDMKGVSLRWIKVIAISEKSVVIYENIEMIGTAVLTPIKFMQDIDQIDKMMKDGDITPVQADQLRSMAFSDCILSGAFQFIQIRQKFKEHPVAEGEMNYKSWIDKGWIWPDAENNKLRITDAAPPTFIKARERQKVLEIRSDKKIIVDGHSHQVSVVDSNGKLNLKICSPKCEIITKRIDNLRQYKIPENLNNQLGRLKGRTNQINESLNSGMREGKSVEAKQQIEELTLELARIAYNYPPYSRVLVDEHSVLNESNANFRLMPAIGETYTYQDGGGTIGKVTRIDFDTLAIETMLGQKTIRKNYQAWLQPSEIGLLSSKFGYEAAHAIGPIVGHESPYGIYFTGWRVNQLIQKAGVENFISQLGKHAKRDTSLYLKVEVKRQTATITHGGENIQVDFLKSITYQVYGVNTSQTGGVATKLFESGFTVAEPTNAVSAVNFNEGSFITSDLDNYVDVNSMERLDPSFRKPDPIDQSSNKQ